MINVDNAGWAIAFKKYPTKRAHYFIEGRSLCSRYSFPLDKKPVVESYEKVFHCCECSRILRSRTDKLPAHRVDKMDLRQLMAARASA